MLSFLGIILENSCLTALIESSELPGFGLFIDFDHNANVMMKLLIRPEMEVLSHLGLGFWFLPSLWFGICHRLFSGFWLMLFFKCARPLPVNFNGYRLSGKPADAIAKAQIRR